MRRAYRISRHLLEFRSRIGRGLATENLTVLTESEVIGIHLHQPDVCFGDHQRETDLPVVREDGQWPELVRRHRKDGASFSRSRVEQLDTAACDSLLFSFKEQPGLGKQRK